MPMGTAASAPRKRHDLGIAHLDRAPGFADGVIRRGTGGAGGKFGPRRSLKYMETRPEAMLLMSIGIMNGEIRFGPRSKWRPSLQPVRWSSANRRCRNRGKRRPRLQIFLFRDPARNPSARSAPSGINAKLRIAVGPADFLGRRKGGRRVKVFHLAGNLRGEQESRRTAKFYQFRSGW